MVTVLHQDRHIVVCIKPAGVLSQDSGENSMPQMLKKQLELSYIAPVHRLDQQVGGVMVYALTEQAAASLSRQIQDHSFEKRYYAVLRGCPAEKNAVLEDLLFHDRNRNKTYVVDRARKGVKDARLSYEVLEEIDGKTVVFVRLFTGRTHQIRVQFASRKLPLVGDGKYGGKEPGTSLALWSCLLKFVHPQTGESLMFRQNPPQIAPWNVFQCWRDAFDG